MLQGTATVATIFSCITVFTCLIFGTYIVNDINLIYEEIDGSMDVVKVGILALFIS